MGDSVAGRARHLEVWASAVLLALGGAASAGAWWLGVGTVHTPGPGFLPFAAATLLALMALGQLLRAAMAPVDHGDDIAAAFATSRWRAIAIVLGTLFGAGFLLERIGFSLAMFLMLAVLFGVVAGKRWWVSLLTAALVVSAARLVAHALGVPVPEGPLGI